MKKLLFLLISINSFSQDIQTTNDDFSNEKIITCSTYKQNAVIVSSLSNEHNLTFSFIARIQEKGIKTMFLSANIITSGIHCYSEFDGKITLLFEDGEKLTLKQASKTTCNNVVNPKYELLDFELTKLLNNNIKKFRILTSDGYMEGSIKPKKQQLIKDTLVLFSMNTTQ
jgi:hypothetical protein